MWTTISLGFWMLVLAVAVYCHHPHLSFSMCALEVCFIRVDNWPALHPITMHIASLQDPQHVYIKTFYENRAMIMLSTIHCLQGCCLIFCNFLFFFSLLFWPGQLLFQHLVNSVDSTDLESSHTCSRQCMKFHMCSILKQSTICCVESTLMRCHLQWPLNA